MGFIGKLISHILSNGLALYAAAYFISGFKLEGDIIAILTVAVVLTLINAFVRPILKLIFIPFMMITLGLFSIIVNAIVLVILDKLSTQLTIEGYLPLLWGTLIIGFVNFIFHLGTKATHKN